MSADVTGQLDLFDLAEECPHCGHESDVHYPPSAGTKGCRVFTCGCRGWVSDTMLEQARAVREEWAARFERAPWVAPYDCSGGMKAGESKSGWVCPGCSQIEPNSFLLNLNHGYDPEVPGRFYGSFRGDVAFGEACTRQRLLASQARAAAERSR